MTRRAAALALLLALPAVPSAGSEVLAQAKQPPTTLTLMAQSPVVTSGHALRARVQATNRDDTEYTNLELKLWVYDPARSRSAYAAGLGQEPPTGVFLVAPFSLEGSLAPGGSRELSIVRKLPELEGRAENALYPMKIQLESNGVAIGVLRSSLVFIHERPVVPLNVSLIFVLDEGVHLGPGGEFLDDHLERSIATGGRFESVVSALEEVPVPVTLVVSPMLLEQLRRMADGYRRASVDVPAESSPAERAGAMLDRLRAVAGRPEIEVVSLPFAGPSVPSLVAAGLHRDLERQMRLGQEMLGELLGVKPTAGLFRPPGGLLTLDAVRALADLDVQALIVDPEDLPPPPGLVLSAPAVARISAGLGRTLRAVAPDPVVADRLEALPEDPRLRARWTIGELSALYLERPSVDRGAAILIHGSHDREFLISLLGSLRAQSLPRRTAWLRPVRASRLLAATSTGERRDLASSRFPRYPPTFMEEVAASRESIAQLESMTGNPTALSQRLEIQVLMAEARDFIRDESAGIAYLDSVQARVRREFGKVEPPSPTFITLTSRDGVIPVTVRNLAGYRVRVRVVLLSTRLEFLEGDSQRVVLERPVQTFTFPVRAQTTGRFPVTVRLETPQGAAIGESQIVVRSTAYNVLALVITLGAALFLAMWWGRRFLPRPRT